MNMQIISNICFYIGIGAIFLFIIPANFILPYTLGKKFDCIMKKYNLSLPKSFGIAPPHVYRANVYALNIALLPNPLKYPKLFNYYKQRFGNFWFREHASTWDKIQSWYITLTIGIAIITCILGMIASFINYIAFI